MHPFFLIKKGSVLSNNAKHRGQFTEKSPLNCIHNKEGSLHFVILTISFDDSFKVLVLIK